MIAGGAGTAQGALVNKETIGTQLTTTTATTCYSLEEQWAHITSIRCVNKETTAQTITVEWVDAAPTTTTFNLVYQASVQVGSHVSLTFDDGFVVRTGDEIRATAAVADAFDVFVTVIATTGRSG